jgi:hypothetical protein
MTTFRSYIRILLALFVFALVLLSAVCVHAQTFVPLAAPPTSSKLGQIYGTTSLAGFLSALFTAAISIGAILAVLRLGYAGYEYMTSDAWGHKSHAREVIGDVVLGLLLLLGTWLILNQINPQILNLNILQNASASTPSGSQTSSTPTPTPEATGPTYVDPYNPPAGSTSNCTDPANGLCTVN